MAASLCAQQNTRDETRTRKAIGRGILSPLRLTIPPPGRTVNLAKRISPSDRGNGLWQALTDRAPGRSDPPRLTKSLTLDGAVAGKLLRAPSYLCLKRQVSRALNRGEECREFLLLRFDERDTLLLKTQRIVQKSTHVLLIGLISGGHLHSELLSRLALPHHQLILLWREPRIGLS